MAVQSKLDRYRPISTLGSGGMGTVRLALDEVLGRQVALKQMNAGGGDQGLSRLRREALIGASVSHPNLVSIYDIVTSDDDQVIVMEYVRGETLREVLGRDGRLADPEALRVLSGVGSALDAIHRQGIVHRDVKPANILLGVEGEVKLADLGIASTLDGTRITTSGAVLGSFRYMAPEQLEGGPTTAAIDIYALSAVAYEALSGCRARAEPNPVALAHAIATSPPPDVRDVSPSVPAEAAALLSRGMSRDPAKRPRSAGELVGQLRAALEPQATAPVQVTRPPRAVSAAAPAIRREVAVPPVRSRTPVAPTQRVRGAGPDRPAPPYAIGRSSRKPAAGILVGLIAVVAAIAAILFLGSSQRGAQHNASASSGVHHSSRSARHGSTRIAGRRSSRRARHSLTRAGSTTQTFASAALAAGAGSQSATTTQSSVAAASSSAPSTSSQASSGTSGVSSDSAGSDSAGLNPVSAVESFYGRAAAHQYADAWALADPTFRSQLAGYDSFQAQQAGDRSILFDRAQIVTETAQTADVAVSTTSVRTDGTKHCSGTVDLVRNAPSAGWLLHLIHINCV